MATLSGVMTADFSQFTTEIDRSVVKLQEFERAGKGTATGLYDLEGGLRQVDATLGTMGIRIGPQIKAIEEMRALAGKSVADIGLAGLAGAITAVGVASVTATRAAIDFVKPWYDVDAAVANATASLLGWGDVAAQRAGAATDVLARATQIAGRNIRDFDEALQIIKTSNDALGASLNTGTARLAEWDRQITKVRNSGDLATITKELNEKSSTVKQLAERFDISSEAITHYMDRTKESTAILEKWRAAEQAGLEKVRVAQEELNQAGGGWRDTLLTIAPAAAATATAYIAMGQNLTTIADALPITEIQVKALDLAYKEQIATLARLEPATQSLDTWMMTAGKQFQVAAESGDQFKTMLELTAGMIQEQAVPQLEKLDETFRSLTTAIAESTSKNAPGSVAMNLGNIAFGTGGLETAYAAYSKRYSAAGVGAIGGGPAEDFLSWALRAGYATKGTQVSNTFNIVDTESEIARRVSDEISRQIQRGSLVT